MTHPSQSVRCKQCGRRMVPRVHHGYSDCPYCLSQQWDQERSVFEFKFFGLMQIPCSLMLMAAYPHPVVILVSLLLAALGIWIVAKANVLKDCSLRQALRLLFRR